MNTPPAPVRRDDTKVSQALDAFRAVSPELLEARALQRRVDRKYLAPASLLEPLLERLHADYALLYSGTEAAAPYETLYFDTPDRRMYEDHRRGRRPRCKVRMRHHVNRQRSFLEIKVKGKNDRTSKARLERPFGCAELDEDACRFIGEHCWIDAARLVPRSTAAFRRITLVGEHVDERLTIDTQVELGVGPRRLRLPNVAIVEIKQGRHSNSTPAARALRDLHIREQAISKYILATATLAPVRTNTLRPAVLAVERLSA